MGLAVPILGLFRLVVDYKKNTSTTKAVKAFQRIYILIYVALFAARNVVSPKRTIFSDFI